VLAAVAAGFTCWGYTGASMANEDYTQKLKDAGASHIFSRWDDFTL
jgi:beta-phosphoglucomutase-like phosphatase (HAD superfamily)